MIWPAFWGRLRAGSVVPLSPDEVRKTLQKGKLLKELAPDGSWPRIDHLVIREHPADRRPPVRALAAVPVLAIPLQVRSALRAAPRIVVPALTRRHPGDLARLPGRPGHQRVVGVRDDPALRRGGQGGPPAAREHPDL